MIEPVLAILSYIPIGMWVLYTFRDIPILNRLGVSFVVLVALLITIKLQSFAHTHPGATP